MMKYILKNCRLFQKREKFILILPVLFTVISSIIVPFVHGLYVNYFTEKNAKNPLFTNLQVEFKKDDKNNRYVTKGEVERLLFQLPESIHKKVINYFVEADIDGLFATECRFVIHGGQYGVCKVFRDNMFQQNRMKNYFTEEQEAQGQRVVFLYGNNKTGEQSPAMEKLRAEGNFVHLQGKKYEIIGRQSWLTDGVLVPFASLHNDTVLNNGINLSFSEPITRQQYNTIKEIINKSLGELAVMPPYVTDADARSRMLHNSLFTTGWIALVMAINFTIIFQYILVQRKKKLGILMICGMDKTQTALACFGKGMLLYVPSYLAGIGIWHWLILPGTGKVYPFLKEACTIKAYAGLFGICLVFTAAVLAASVIKNVLKPPIWKIIGDSDDS